ncbi:ABC transporter ATP-binding protein/permease [Streptosporangium sp. NBC_01810]|uniref:ABC transporter ATP-binding protein n=1 Tax=Streptosporangium sp. NBC_01810 TaxID=2975951 RepID=UPI002DDB6FD7|nr:ABC transporter ATP-binding protein [Streptosporangium sp. NBC_01810]WSA23171.1 ABC transporter ATP-binding protein/permease [Streptosporangium sp. NBC_01810]
MTGASILRRTMRRNAARLSAGTLLTSLHQVCEASVPILIGVIVDRAIGLGDTGSLLWWLTALAALFTVLSLAYRYGARTLMRAIAHEAHLLRLEFAAKIIDPRGLDTDLRAGELLTISSNDADNTSELLDYLPRAVGALVAAAVCAVTLLLIDTPLGVAVLVATPLTLLALHVGTPYITRHVAAQQELAGQAAALATDLVSGVRPLRGIGAEAAASQRYARISRLSLAAALRAGRTQAIYTAVSGTGGALLACGVAVLAGWFALRGQISAGEFLTVIGLAQFLMEPVGTLTMVPGWVAEARASADRVARVAGAPVLLPADTDLNTDINTDLNADLNADTGEAGPPDGGPGGLEVSGVSYDALAGLNLVAGPGEFVGVMAHRPADADALVRVLSGRVNPAEYSGSVRVGGRILVEPHHTDLFEGTLATNLAVGGRPGNPEELATVLAASAADDVVAAHPDGLERQVVERGASLSGGQRQRVALARALLARPPILVLHDPTTAVDAVTEQGIAWGLRSLRHPEGGGTFTTVVVTSSPALLAATDRVFVLDGGKVVAKGSHADLGATDDDYRRAVQR